MYRSIATLLISLLLCHAGAQDRRSYEAYKALVNTYPNTTLFQNHYQITTDSGTGLADTMGNILLPPHFESSISNDYIEFKSPYESAYFDRDLTLRQRGPYQRFWKLPGIDRLYYLFTNDGKGGVCNSGGRWIIPPVYDAVTNYDGFRWPLVLLSKDGRFGAIDTSTGQAVIPFRFDYFTQPRPFIVGHISDSVVLYDSLGRMLAARPYHDIKYIDGHFIGDVHGALALLDPKTLFPLTPFVYKEFAGLKSPRYIAFKDLEGNFYGVMNAAGETVLPERYDYIAPLDGRSFAGHQDLKEVLFDQDFRELIPLRGNQYFRSLSEGDEVRHVPPIRDWIDVSIKRETGTPWLWGEEDQDHSYLYNTRLRKAVPYVRRSRSYAGVYLEGSLIEVYKLSDMEFARPLLMRQNGVILPITYRDVEPLSNHALKVVKEDGKSGLLDTAGRWILKPEWEAIARVTDEVFAVSPMRTSPKDLLYYELVNILGKPVSDIKFTEPPHRYGTGYSAVSDNRWGLLDSAFQVTLPLIYDHRPVPLSDRQNYTDDSSRLLVSNEGNNQIITRTGDVLLSVKDASIVPWAGALLLTKRDSFAVATRDGRLVTSFVPRNAFVVLNHFGDVAIKTGDKWGVLSHLGDTLQPFQYDSVMSIPLQRYWVLKEGAEYTVVNSVGMPIASKLRCLPVRVSSDGRTIVCDTNNAYVKKASGWKEKRGSYIATTQPLFQRKELFHIAVYNGQGIKAGVYNRSYRRIGDAPNGVHYNQLRSLQTGHFLLIPDSAARNFSVIDTSGKIVFPVTRADSFWLMPQAAVAFDTALRRYIIYHLRKRLKPDTAFVFSSDWRRGSANARFAAWPTWSPPRGTFMWYNANGTGLIDLWTNKDTFLQGLYVRAWSHDQLLAREMHSSKWGIVSADANNWKLRPEMDTIYGEGQTFRIRRNGRMGLLDPVDLREIIPAVWDTIFSDGGAENRKATYWVAKRDGKYSVVLPGGRILTDGWDNLTTWSTRLYIQGARNGKTQRLYPDGKGGITIAEPSAPAPKWSGTGDQYIYPFMEGGNRGLYSLLERRVLVPAVCQEIENEYEFFVCTNYSGAQQGKSVYNKGGQLKFRLPVTARLDYLHEGDFWRVEGYDKASALDTNGRVFVPGGYSDIWRIGENLFVVEKDDKYGIMSSGGQFVEPLLWRGIETLYTPLVGYRGDSVCLMQVKGQTIVKHCYEQVVQRGYYRAEKVYEWYAQKGGKWGIVRHDGTVVMPFKYDSYEAVPRGSIQIRVD